MSALKAKSAAAARNGEYELFKTTTIFDSTAMNPEWLGEESERTKSLTRA